MNKFWETREGDWEDERVIKWQTFGQPGSNIVGLHFVLLNHLNNYPLVSAYIVSRPQYPQHIVAQVY